ncbi:mannitol-1-phosphate/altronate dehydrogenase [Penicillium pulvis]|uniref:mannitol-1-phosphate/altronate dehydrogenase n=1 Tax=Penicillium pulvis TaxID=1562058 RepID=UPI002547A240|nr:mannitol-1-phosphate/altronate dehydrogenase [Penicillium pulvis]KAJ5803022.1 mannitol-1-phosphate/altronate dehydrogenase [Penicillium pulvis]
MAPLKLNQKNLPQICAAAPVQFPSYSRGDAVKEGIVHIGVGGFHRAHLAVYVDQLMQHHGVTDYAICGVGLQPWDVGMRDALGGQDHLYTAIERSAKGSVAKVMGSINSFLFAPDNREAVIAKMAHPDTHIVSLTITESGYYYNENTHELQTENPDIQHDLDPANNAPKTTFGFLYHAMDRRRQQGLNPFTVMSCDNMQGNGAITRHMLVSFARVRNPELAEWINTKAHFPNAMVDRITPQTSPADKVSLAQEFGIEDAWPIVTEPFMQWVIEDHFSDGRPPFEKVGVQIVKNVKNVEEFEKHKLRLLNGSHAIIAYGGQLAGYKYVHEVMQDPLFNKFIWQLMQEETKPTLPEIEGVSIDDYCKTLVERFSNPTIMDQLPRICGGGTGKIPQFIMPTIAEAIWVTGPFRRLCFTAATWFHYINGVDDNGNKIDVQDPMLEEIQTRARNGGTNPMELLNIKNLFGEDLRSDKRFIETITIALEEIARDGVLKSLPKYID